ncbi:MAG TPA: LapA family protein [Candidatus Acidoferrum sp.]|nr:LapA family protein [Candidatus Acidoferrum sp.]
MADGRDLQPQRKETNWRVWGLGVLVILVIIFIAQNSQSVKVKFLFVDTTAPLIFLLVITVLLGMIIGYVTPIVRSRRRDHEQR